MKRIIKIETYEELLEVLNPKMDSLERTIPYIGEGYALDSNATSLVFCPESNFMEISNKLTWRGLQDYLEAIHNIQWKK
jgi:hypothetical protein